MPMYCSVNHNELLTAFPCTERESFGSSRWVANCRVGSECVKIKLYKWILRIPLRVIQ